MSPDRSEGVFGALGWAGDRAKARALPHYAGPVTERTNGLVPEQSGGTKPTGSVHEASKLVHVSRMHIMEIEEAQNSMPVSGHRFEQGLGVPDRRGGDGEEEEV